LYAGLGDGASKQATMAARCAHFGMQTEVAAFLRDWAQGGR
jgi:hypothetical protein